MPRYFFDFQDGDQSTPDVEGTEMDTREAAGVTAISPNTIHLSKNSVHLKSPVDKNPSVFNI
jgi:hypothetical protein